MALQAKDIPQIYALHLANTLTSPHPSMHAAAVKLTSHFVVCLEKIQMESFGVDGSKCKNIKFN